MKKFLTINIVLLILTISAYRADAQGVANQKSSGKQAAWEKIAPYFTPPSDFKGKYGDFRSPLKFYNGADVKNAKDWEKRRKEIFNRWNGLMGEWPALLKDQKFTVLDIAKKDGYTQYTVSFKWLPHETTTGYLLVPHGKEKMPAVISVYYNPETAIGIGKPYRDYALQLAKRGFVTLSIGTTQASKSRTFSLYYPSIEDAKVQPLSMLAYGAANAWYALSKVAEVDSEKIGVIGHSFGGKWAMFAAALFDKFACGVWSDPGIVFDETKGNGVNYWEPWYLGYYNPPWGKVFRKKGMVPEAKGLYPKLVKEGYDLQELHALIAPRPFLVSGGSADPVYRWVPLNHTIAVNDLLGYKNRVAMTNRPKHVPDEDANEKVYSFFEYFLKYNGIAEK